ncbi:MAG TPA: hypothetical protein VK927_07765 [Adhaeribacter sp.]|nr:hypothetical protein [Adhaeribacter sp.]
MSKLGISHLLQFFIFIIIQIFLIRYLVLFNTGFCFIYIAFLLFLPIQLPAVLLLLIGFTTGITIDTFYDTAGIHAGACVLLAYIRPYVLRFLTPRDDYDVNDSVNVRLMGWRWFITYALVLIFLHHLLLFFLELGGIKMVGFTMLKVLTSTFYTFIVIVIVQLLFFSARRVAR